VLELGGEGGWAYNEGLGKAVSEVLSRWLHNVRSTVLGLAVRAAIVGVTARMVREMKVLITISSV
jgi:hypothetical protein